MKLTRRTALKLFLNTSSELLSRRQIPRDQYLTPAGDDEEGIPDCHRRFKGWLAVLFVSVDLMTYWHVLFVDAILVNRNPYDIQVLTFLAMSVAAVKFFLCSCNSGLDI
ncbi:hypothetical protein BJX65DRAFT_140555 [Aspergillus insuetus]